MEATAVGVTVFAAIRFLLWLIVIISGAYLVRTMYLDYHQYQITSRMGRPWLSHLLSTSLGWGMIVWLCIIAGVLFYTGLETSYRPKTVIRSVNPELQRQLRARDSMPPPVIAPTQPTYNMDQALKNNRQENQKVREAFQQLP